MAGRLRAARHAGHAARADGFRTGFRELDLTDDQKAQLKSIAESHRDEFRAAGEKARAAHDGMQALVEADSINESAIRAKSAEIAAAEAEVMILNAKVRQESMQVLTSEQQQKLKELRAAREAQMKQRQAARTALNGLRVSGSWGVGGKSSGLRTLSSTSALPDSIAILRCPPFRSSSPRCGRADRCRPSNR